MALYEVLYELYVAAKRALPWDRENKLCWIASASSSETSLVSFALVAPPSFPALLRLPSLRLLLLLLFLLLLLVLRRRSKVKNFPNKEHAACLGAPIDALLFVPAIASPPFLPIAHVSLPFSWCYSTGKRRRKPPWIGRPAIGPPNRFQTRAEACRYLITPPCKAQRRQHPRGGVEG